jgi:membrane protein implicated in regulation of membrane protease activity
MGSGLFLVVVGAILAFAVDDQVPHINLGVTGVIIMLAGAAVIAHARTHVERERIITRRDSDDEDSGGHVVEEVVREHDTGHFGGRRESSY